MGIERGCVLSKGLPFRWLPPRQAPSPLTGQRSAMAMTLTPQQPQSGRPRGLSGFQALMS